MSPFEFHRRSNVPWVWNNMMVTKWWPNFQFWVHCSFKCSPCDPRGRLDQIKPYRNLAQCMSVFMCVCQRERFLL